MWKDLQLIPRTHHQMRNPQNKTLLSQKRYDCVVAKILVHTTVYFMKKVAGSQFVCILYLFHVGVGS